MLPLMKAPTLATLRAVADLHRLPWSDADLEAALPAVAAALQMLASLDAIPLSEAAEPTTHFRVV
jgi:hypothetical protein